MLGGVVSSSHAQSAMASESTASGASNATPAPTASLEARKNSVVASQFTLGAADVIRVNVWKNVDLSQTVTVGPDGFVSLPLLGDVHVSGMTANELAQV